MSKIIEGLYYAESHEYVRVEGEYGYIGITDYAQHEEHDTKNPCNFHYSLNSI